MVDNKNLQNNRKKLNYKKKILSIDFCRNFIMKLINI